MSGTTGNMHRPRIRPPKDAQVLPFVRIDVDKRVARGTGQGPRPFRGRFRRETQGQLTGVTDERRRALYNIIAHLLGSIDYKASPRVKAELPERQKRGSYREPDYPYKLVPEEY